MKEKWCKVFSEAKHGHILWDGNATDPSNPQYAYDSAWDFVEQAQSLKFFQKDHRVLDLGCGNGRLAIPFSEMRVSYVGIDPVRESIAFCKKAFKNYTHLDFQFADIYNESFNPCGEISPDDYRIPFGNDHFDDVIAYSVFTHLQTLNVARNYMSEIKRTLKPGGKFFCSWYRSPPNPRPESFVGRTVYYESEIMTLLQGFTCELSYGGHTDQYYDQWGLFCTKL